jgi:hypothetical protein
MWNPWKFSRWDKWFGCENQRLEHTIYSENGPAGQPPYVKTAQCHQNIEQLLRLDTRHISTALGRLRVPNGRQVGRSVERDPQSSDGTNLKYSTTSLTKLIQMRTAARFSKERHPFTSDMNSTGGLMKWVRQLQSSTLPSTILAGYLKMTY